jgi:hypothetical protein
MVHGFAQARPIQVPICLRDVGKQVLRSTCTLAIALGPFAKSAVG